MHVKLNFFECKLCFIMIFYCVTLILGFFLFFNLMSLTSITISECCIYRS